jgi:hypothetical protein
MTSLIVRGVYDYRATGEDEIDIKEGSLIQLTTGPQGGQKYGEGWWEGQYFITHSPHCTFSALWEVPRSSLTPS